MKFDSKQTKSVYMFAFEGKTDGKHIMHNIVVLLGINQYPEMKWHFTWTSQWNGTSHVRICHYYHNIYFPFRIITCQWPTGNCFVWLNIFWPMRTLVITNIWLWNLLVHSNIWGFHHVIWSLITVTLQVPHWIEPFVFSVDGH